MAKGELSTRYPDRWRPKLREFLATQKGYVKSTTAIQAWMDYCPEFYPDRKLQGKIQMLGMLLSMELPMSNSRGGKVYTNTYAGVATSQNIYSATEKE